MIFEFIRKVKNKTNSLRRCPIRSHNIILQPHINGASLAMSTLRDNSLRRDSTKHERPHSSPRGKLIKYWVLTKRRPFHLKYVLDKEAPHSRLFTDEELKTALHNDFRSVQRSLKTFSTKEAGGSSRYDPLQEGYDPTEEFCIDDSLTHDVGPLTTEEYLSKFCRGDARPYGLDGLADARMDEEENDDNGDYVPAFVDGDESDDEYVHVMTFTCAFCDCYYLTLNELTTHEISCRSRVVNNAGGASGALEAGDTAADASGAGDNAGGATDASAEDTVPFPSTLMFKCDFCDTFFLNNDSALTHEATCGSRVGASSAAGAGAASVRFRFPRYMFKCESCDTYFLNSDSALTHEATCGSRVGASSAAGAGEAGAAEAGSSAAGVEAASAVSERAGSNAEMAIPIIDEVTYGRRGANYDDIDKLPVFKVEWSYNGEDKGTSVTVKDGDQCSICWVNFNGQKIAALPKCKHVFCYECIVRWLLQNANCPKCRATFKE